MGGGPSGTPSPSLRPPPSGPVPLSPPDGRPVDLMAKASVPPFVADYAPYTKGFGPLPTVHRDSIIGWAETTRAGNGVPNQQGIQCSSPRAFTAFLQTVAPFQFFSLPKKNPLPLKHDGMPAFGGLTPDLYFRPLSTMPPS